MKLEIKNGQTISGTEIDARKFFCQNWTTVKAILTVVYTNGGWWTKFVVGLVITAGDKLKEKVCLADTKY